MVLSVTVLVGAEPVVADDSVVVSSAQAVAPTSSRVVAASASTWRDAGRPVRWR